MNGIDSSFAAYQKTNGGLSVNTSMGFVSTLYCFQQSLTVTYLRFGARSVGCCASLRLVRPLVSLGPVEMLIGVVTELATLGWSRSFIVNYDGTSGDSIVEVDDGLLYPIS